ncbi:hypothetical protein ACZ87_01725, partial [Candidatus Erwinia dacicola]
ITRKANSSISLQQCHNFYIVFGESHRVFVTCCHNNSSCEMVSKT